VVLCWVWSFLNYYAECQYAARRYDECRFAYKSTLGTPLGKSLNHHDFLSIKLVSETVLELSNWTVLKSFVLNFFEEKYFLFVFLCFLVFFTVKLNSKDPIFVIFTDADGSTSGYKELLMCCPQAILWAIIRNKQPSLRINFQTGPNAINFLRLKFMNFRVKLKYLALASLSNLV
jgi:hypothetical protein